MQLDLLTFRRERITDAKEYRDALSETIDSVGLYKTELVQDIGVGKRRLMGRILYRQLDDTDPAEYFVLMAGKRLVAHGYAVKRATESWVEVGLWVRRQYQGQGVGTYMLQRLTSYCLENIDCDGVYLIHEASNGAMANIASKSGFEIAEATERKTASGLDRRLIETDVISGFNVHRIVHNPKSKKGVRTKYGKKWPNYRDRPLSQKIQIIPYWHLDL